MDTSIKTLESVSIPESKFSILLSAGTIHSFILTYYFCAHPYAQLSYRRYKEKVVTVPTLMKLIINLGNHTKS